MNDRKSEQPMPIGHVSPATQADCTNPEDESARRCILASAPGSPEWSARVLELIKRDDMNDFKELCELMGVPD